MLIWSPVIEPDVGQPIFLPENPIRLITNGKFKQVPFITGRTRDEFGWFSLSKYYIHYSYEILIFVFLFDHLPYHYHRSSSDIIVWSLLIHIYGVWQWRGG